MAKKKRKAVKRKGSRSTLKGKTKGKKPRSASGKSKNSKVRKLIKLAKLRNKQKKGKKKSGKRNGRR